MDTQLWPMAQSLLALLREVSSQQSDPPQRVEMRVGEEVPHDLDGMTDVACAGLAYVTIGAQTPVWTGVSSDAARAMATNCPPPMWIANFRTGVIRCSPVGTLQGMPSAQEWEAAARRDADDAQMLRLVSCQWRSRVMDLPSMFGMRVAMGDIQQVPPQGGVVERFVELQAQIPNLDCC